MVDRFGEFADKLTTYTDPESIWLHTAEYGKNVGYGGCSFVTARKGDEGIEAPKTITDLSDEFKHAYMKDELGKLDPFLLFSCQSLVVSQMKAEGLSSYPGASKKHQAFLDHIMENGVAGGLGIPVRTSENDVFGGWIFTYDAADRFADLLCRDHGTEVHLAAVLAYERMVAVGLNDESECKLLSNRERECLLWLCAGLRVAAIAGKLSVSDSAVKLYITNAKLKLGAKTREQAVARAIISGEIVL